MTQSSDPSAESGSKNNVAQYVSLSDLLDYEQPQKYLVQSKSYDDSHPTPVLTAGKTFILGYTDEDCGIYPASEGHPVIIFDDFTTATRWVDFPFKVKSSAMKMLTLKDGIPADFRFVFYAMQNLGSAPTEHARQWISQFSSFRVPLPRLDVQRAISRTLTLFEHLILSLENELRLRSIQAEWAAGRYFRSQKTQSVRALSHVFAFGKGTQLLEVDRKGGDYPVVTAGRSASGLHSEFNSPPESITVSSHGAYAGHIAWWQSRIWLSNNVIGLLPLTPEWPTRYLYHALHAQQKQIRALARGGGVPYINLTDLKSASISLHSPAESEEIADDLDTFVELKLALESELAARRKQYEYYRDRLLTFEELPA